MLLIDNREGSRDIPKYLPSSIPYEMTMLSSGDIALMGNGPDGIVPVGIEHKTISDLVNCITTGRLSGHQLIGMMEEYKYSYLLIEGVWRSCPEDGVLEIAYKNGWVPLSPGRRRFMARDVINYLNSLQVQCRVIVWRTGGKRETGEWIANTYHWWKKKWEEHKSVRQCYSAGPDRVYLYRPGIVHRICKEFEGVGWEKAEEMAKRFKTVEELMAAGEKELQTIPGIGKVLAKSIFEELHGQGGG